MLSTESCVDGLLLLAAVKKIVDHVLGAVDGLLRAVAACRFQFKTNYWDVSEAEEQARILRQTAEQWEAMQAEVGAEGQETEAAGTPK